MISGSNQDIVVEKKVQNLAISDKNVRRILSQFYIHADRPYEALALLEGSSECFCPLECFYLGKALLMIGEHEKAIEIWRRVKNVDVYFALLGDSIYSVDDGKDLARQYYVLSWRISSSPVRRKRTMLLNLCLDSRADGRKQDAVEWCKNAAAASRDYWVLVELGRTLYEASDYQSAENALSEAIILAPSLGAAYQYLGMTLQKLGKKPESIEALTKSVSLMPDSVWPRVILADVLLSYGCYDQAMKLYARAINLTKKSDLRLLVENRMYNAKKILGNPSSGRDCPSEVE